MKVPEIIKSAAHDLRVNMTEAEKTLWEKLKQDSLLGKRCVRQKPIPVHQEDSGIFRYIIADFVYLQDKVIIELDGGIHLVPEVLSLDTQKELLLKNLGYTIIRFTNQDIFDNLHGVLEKIKENLQPSVFRMKEGDSEEDYDLSGDSEEDYENAESSSESSPLQKEGDLQKKRFIMRNESFTCENCGNEISKHPTGSARNHCPFCLYSKHLDKDFPGDRLSECFGMMKPIAKDHKKKGWMIVHECQKCRKKIPNILAGDDSVEIFAKL